MIIRRAKRLPEGQIVTWLDHQWIHMAFVVRNKTVREVWHSNVTGLWSIFSVNGARHVGSSFPMDEEQAIHFLAGGTKPFPTQWMVDILMTGALWAVLR